MADETMLTQAALLKRGWTKKLIEAFLPEPTRKKNPMFASAAPLKLWPVAQIEAAEATEEYQVALAKVNVQRGYAKKSIETKRQKLLDQVQEILDQVEVPVVDQKELESTVLREKQAWYELQNDPLYYCMPAWTAERETIDRWTVNYIRHELVKCRGKKRYVYDKTLGKIKGSVGIDDAYALLHNAILDRIAEVYPMYANECERQKVVENMVS